MTRRGEFIAGVVIGFAISFLNGKYGTPSPPADLTDPDVLLSHAQAEMREAQAKNRERAIQIITRKNHLRALVDQTQKQIESLREKAQIAQSKGDSKRAQLLLAEAASQETSQIAVRASLEKMNTTVSEIKSAIRLEEENIRAKSAQALAMKAQWNNIQIMQSIEQDMLAELERLERAELGSDLFEQVQMRINVAEATRQETRKAVEAKFDLICERLTREEQKAIQAGNENRAEAIRAEQDALRQMFSL